MLQVDRWDWEPFTLIFSIRNYSPGSQKETCAKHWKLNLFPLLQYISSDCEGAFSVRNRIHIQVKIAIKSQVVLEFKATHCKRHEKSAFCILEIH